MPDLVRINQYWTLATNVELLEAKWLHNDRSTRTSEILTFPEWPLLNSTLHQKTTIQLWLKSSNKLIPTWLLLQSLTHCCKKLKQPLLLLSDHSQCLANYWKKTEILISKMSKNACCCITINNCGNCIVWCLLKNCRGSNMYKLYIWLFFYAQPVGRMFFFRRCVVMHRLVAYFIKFVHQNVIISQNTLSQKKSKFSNNKVKNYFVYVKIKMALVIKFSLKVGSQISSWYSLVIIDMVWASTAFFTKLSAV